MTGRHDFTVRTSNDIFHDVDLNSSDDEHSVIEINEDGFPAPVYNYPRPYVPMSPQYIPHRGLVRYNAALKHLIPIRRKKKKKKVISIDEAGFFSLITFSWMSRYIYLSYKKGLTVDDIPMCSSFDSCDLNAQRLELLWQEELVQKGPNDASFGRAVWRFTRTRVLISCVAFIISCMMGFLSPTIFMRKLLEYSSNPEASDISGVTWALALACSELMRTLFFALCWSVSYRTATRLRAACLAMIYRKIIRLHSIGNKSVGELINIYGSDGPRLFNMIVFGPLIIGGPFVAICGCAYIYLLLGPWALIGMAAFLVFYPIQFGISRLTGHYRGKTIVKSDERIRLTTEILNCIKWIKMYAWEDYFSENLFDVRRKELAELQKASYCQSISITVAPTIPIISGIITFLSHVLAGGNLSAAQVFSILVFLTKHLKTAITSLRDASLSFYEACISIKRFKAFPALTFVTKQLRMTLKHFQESCFALHQGIISFARFKTFPLITILQSQLRTALNNLRYGCENIIEGKVTLARIQDILLIEENTTHISHQIDKSLSVCINEGTFAWDSGISKERNVEKVKGCKTRKDDDEKVNLNTERVEKHLILHNINISVTKGSLVGVCGSVGSGKTSLLLACLGQMKILSGQLSATGRTAYVSQQAWIENATVKENILFGEPFDAVRYINVLFCCALSEDVNLLPGGDETIIGERGINLSGGQKQRISLARALYSNRDVYYLDDPLSAVDPEVGSHIFEKCILGSLSKKTVLLVTHHVQFLQKCDEIFVMKEGRIVERGTHHELLSRGREYSFMVQSSTAVTKTNADRGEDKKGEDYSKLSARNSKNDEDNSSNIKKLHRKQFAAPEEQLRGEVKAFAYHAYIKAAGGYILSFTVVMAILFNVGSNVFSSWWLAVWINAGSGNTTTVDPATNETIISTNLHDNPDLNFYIQVYGLTIVVIIVSCILRGFIFTRVTIRASRILHKNIYSKMISSPVRYFETTPIGRIQNLFSRDLDEIDARLPSSVETMLQNIWMMMFSFLFITLVFPWFVVPLVVLAVLYYFISKIFRVAVRDLKRIENISLAPIFSSVSATVQGLPTIHAYNKENDYIAQFSKVFDENSTSMFLSCNAMRWMATRLDSISVTISCITSLLVVALKGSVPPALAGLALTYAAQISGVFQYTIRLMSETETRFISVERIQHNIEKLEIEGSSKTAVSVPSDWPSKGAIKFQNVVLSYGRDLPDVLNGVSFSVKAGEKIGVVGRTGAGKSSLAVALFRLVELTSGKIIVDNIDISSISLPILRSRLSVIPQDPVLFTGSLRTNLDPFKKFKDDQIWEVLKKTKLCKKVNLMSNQLETIVGDGSDGFSVGERQLLCLARALLRGSNVLILDEATASVDPETETAIQATISDEFENCTVFTIAHRLSTVTSCNRVLVMDQGMVVEMDDPKVLLDDSNSHFSKMCAALGVL